MSGPRSPYAMNRVPTAVLVHGGFEDASSWMALAGELQAMGMQVVAPSLTLRSLAADAAILADVAATIDGPVLLVGHSYGGAVISAAGASLANVVGLVFVAGFALAEGESVLDVLTRHCGTALPQALRPEQYRRLDGLAAVELYIEADAFHQVLASDLPLRTATALAAVQRPVAVAAIEEASAGAAWQTLATTYVVVAGDNVVGLRAQRFMASRAGARTFDVEGSHAGVLTHPATLATIIGDSALADEGADPPRA